MSKKFLLTSFQTWLPHHVSNASDDLLAQISGEALAPISLSFLRQLPVDIALASTAAIAKIQHLQPDIVICCGMAETRSHLTLESNAWCRDRQLKTSLNLERLVAKLKVTKISHNAGKFVCEGLYFQLLNYCQTQRLPTLCLFVHVPLLTPHNNHQICEDFLTLMTKMTDSI